ncbi:MAG: hypothetical protein E7392_02945 [Ruminococcaceae bacterium]|nr:hypothetical protein [Oscillospiraceae bacterium]
MQGLKELEKRDKRIENDRRKICELTQEIEALRQLLDCAAANISLLVKEHGGSRKISRSDVSKALGKYRLQARTDDEGNYLLELIENTAEKEVT